MLHGEIKAAWHALSQWQQQAVAVALVLIIGYVAMRFGIKAAHKAMRKSRHVDDTLTSFVHGVLSAVGWIVIGVIVLAIFGVPPSALAGGLAVGGFIIGFALKDTLGNLAAGIMLLFYRPFNVGDTVTVSGQEGQVQGIGLALTTVQAADGRVITLPNGKVLGDAVVNHTRLDKRRADVLVGIGYDDDIDTAVKAILEALGKDERVLAEPEPGVRITALGDSSVNLQVRPWVKTADYWQAKADFHGLVKRAVEAAGCSIPFPQRDIHVFQESA